MKCIILTLILIINLSFCQEWDYAKRGKDWYSKGFKTCDFVQKNPIKIKAEDSSELKSTEYFLPRMNKKATGILHLESQNNILVLNFSDYQGSTMGHLMFNRDKKIKDFNCTAITFRMPGEITFEDKIFPLELQVNCSGMRDLNNKENVLISLVVEIADKTIDEKQSKIFDQFHIEAGAKLPIQITIDNFYDFLDPLTVYDKVYVSSDGYTNFPPCNEPITWFAIEKTYKINKELYDILWNLLDLTKNPLGDSREATERDEMTILEHYFNSFK